MKRVKHNPKLYKEKILAWAKKHDRLPSYRSKNSVEKRYAHRMENYLSPKSGSFDPEFRALIFSKFDRKVHDKREHDKALRVKELIEFIKNHNRVPFVGKVCKEERIIRSTLDNYANPSSALKNDKLVEFVFSIDKCYKTTIPVKYRQCINEALGRTGLEEEKVK